MRSRIPTGIILIWVLVMLQAGEMNCLAVLNPPAKATVLTLDAPSTVGLVSKPGEANWFTFTVATNGNYTVISRTGTLLDIYLRLYSPDMTLLMQKHIDSSNDPAAYAQTLAPGKYYLMLNALMPDEYGSYIIRVARGPAAVPAITSFKINNGATSTTNPSLSLKISCTGADIREMLIGDDPKFEHSRWEPFSANATYGPGADSRLYRVYVKVRNALGVESAVQSAAIELRYPIDIYDNNGGEGTINDLTKNGWFTFTVTTPMYYDIVTSSSADMDDHPLAGAKTFLCGPNDMGRMIAQDDGAAAPGFGRIIRKLTAGKYYIHVQPRRAGQTGSYYFDLLKNDAPIFLEDFHLADNVFDRKILLMNSVGGVAVNYMVSESAKFKGAKWKTYSAAPSYQLSSNGEDYNDVYLKVRDGAGHESNVIDHYTTYHSPNKLELDHDVRGKVPGDWPGSYDYPVFTFTIKQSGTYLFSVKPDDWANDLYWGLNDYFLTIYQGTTDDQIVGEKEMFCDDVYAIALKPGNYSLMLDGAPIEYSDGWRSGKYTLRVSKSDAKSPVITEVSTDVTLTSSTARTVAFGLNCLGKPVQAKCAFDAKFKNAVWQAYPPSPSIVIPNDNDSIVYLKVRDAAGKESNVTERILPATGDTVSTITIDAPATEGYRGWDDDYYRFTVSTPGLYTIETLPATGEYEIPVGVEWSLSARDGSKIDPQYANFNDGFQVGTFYLAPGSYSIRVDRIPYTDDDSNQVYLGYYDIRVASGWGGNVAITAMAINQGLESTSGDTVTLNNICQGKPVKYSYSFQPYENWSGGFPYDPAPKIAIPKDFKRPGILEIWFNVTSIEGISSDWGFYDEIYVN